MNTNIPMPGSPSIEVMANNVQLSVLSIIVICVVATIIAAILASIVIAIVFAVKKSSKNK